MTPPVVSWVIQAGGMAGTAQVAMIRWYGAPSGRPYLPSPAARRGRWPQHGQPPAGGLD
jgi:hypothetical protein